MILTVVHPVLQKQADEMVYIMTDEERISRTDQSGYVPLEKMVARFRAAGENLVVFRAADPPDSVPELNPLVAPGALEDRLAAIDEAIARGKQARVDYEMAKKAALAARRKAREDRILNMEATINKIKARRAANAQASEGQEDDSSVSE